MAIEESPAVAYWVRNLDHGDGCFRLPKSSSYFYPDFVAELKDGRILVIEYKGKHLEDKQSEQEKRDIGRLWEARSGGRALFFRAVKADAARGAPPPDRGESESVAFVWLQDPRGNDSGHKEA